MCRVKSGEEFAMTRILPFRGIRYTDKVDLDKVITQPYDKIKDDLIDEYYKRSLYNFTRIIQAEVNPDTPKDNKYIRARKYLDKWFKKGILKRDKVPAIYPYYQEYTIDGVTRTRKGVSVLVNLRETEIKAHEKTLDGPKADRLKLMGETGCYTEHVFILYPDPKKVVNDILDSVTESKKPIAVGHDDFDCTHKLWVLTDKKKIKAIQDFLAPQALFIADGHHRTETAVNYMKAADVLGVQAKGTELPENCLMTLISMDDPGLLVLPTHRFVHSVPEFNKDKFLEKAGKYFKIKIPKCDGTCGSGGKKLTEMMEKAVEENEHAIGVHFKDKTCALLTLKKIQDMDKLAPRNEKGDMMSETWRTLDVTILHTILLDSILGIDAEKLAAQSNVIYHRHVEDGLKSLSIHPRANALFVLNATKTEEVRLVASAGERMPQKSTDYFPKLISGMVFSKIQYSGYPKGKEEFLSI
jgi:uncharacterized protein (DUF1015 family)